MAKKTEDLLNRKAEVDLLTEYLLARYKKNSDEPFVLNINAEWGYGKTYFLDLMAKELKDKKYTVIEFDAWKNDYTKEPLLAFISEVNNSLDEYFSNESSKDYIKALKKHSLPILASFISKKITGMGIDELNDLAEDEDTQNTEDTDSNDDIKNGLSSLTIKLAQQALQEHNTIKGSIEKFKKSMRDLLEYIESLNQTEGKMLPLFILIDELDRCRPNYSIELLESIKHLFDIEGIIFVIATDSKQLSHSINAVYGEKFASQQYLKRFFDQEYNLIVPNNYEYIEYCLWKYDLLDDNMLFSGLEDELYSDKNTKVELLNLYTEFFQLNPRDINQVILSLSTIRLGWKDKNTKIHLVYLLFLIILKHKHEEQFIQYKDDKNIKNIFEILKFDYNVKIKSLSIIENGFSESHNSIDVVMRELIETYHNLLYISSKDFNSERNSCNITYVRSIYDVFNDNNEIQHILNNNKISIKKYFELVLHAGQFR